MAQSITPHFMFIGTAEEAMTLYVSLFAGSEILEVDRWQAGEPGAEGSIKKATFTLGGRAFSCGDSPNVHDFTFTPSLSLFVDCESEGELNKVFARLEDSGKVLMPVDNYGFSRKFGWVEDRYGVSWQLNLP